MRNSFFSTVAEDLIAEGMSPLVPLQAQFDDLAGHARSVAGQLPATMAEAFLALANEITAFRVPVTLFGQVKAGKTALANMLIGRPGFLPSHVNPWTAVVTQLFINGEQDPAVAARFCFYDQADWQKLIGESGRLAQLARAAGAAEEQEQIRAQVLDLQLQAQQRLGKHYDQLLGQQHCYDHCDPLLIARYVSQGEGKGAKRRIAKGHFADITKRAEIYLDQPGYPLPLVLQDTPGVNDPLLLREEATLATLEQAGIAIVVLSATQALSRADMGMLHLLSGLEGRACLLFVNRIDELSDPQSQIGELRQRLQEAWHKHGLAPPLATVFGAVRWAEAALAPEPAAILSGEAYVALRRGLRAADQSGISALPLPPTPQQLWQLSGLPELQNVLAEAIAEGPAQQALLGWRGRLQTLLIGAVAALRAQCEAPLTAAALAGLQQELAALHQRLEAAVAAVNTTLLSTYAQRLQQAGASYQSLLAAQFASKGAAIFEHAAVHLPLRMRWRSAHASCLGAARAAYAQRYAGLLRDLAEIYAALAPLHPEMAAMSAPELPNLPLPTAMQRQFSLRPERIGWRQWMARQPDKAGLLAQYQQLIQSEMNIATAEMIQVTGAALQASAARATEYMQQQAGFFYGEPAQATGHLPALITQLDGLLQQLAAPGPLASSLHGAAQFLQGDATSGDAVSDCDAKACASAGWQEESLPQNILVLRHAI